jgi:hypothetical protein
VKHSSIGNQSLRLSGPWFAFEPRSLGSRIKSELPSRSDCSTCADAT